MLDVILWISLGLLGVIVLIVGIPLLFMSLGITKTGVTFDITRLFTKGRQRDAARSESMKKDLPS